MCKSWLPHILHCYDIPGLPRSNLDLESTFGTLRRDQRRISGRKETSPIRIFGPGAIALLALDDEEVLPLLQSVSPETYWSQRRRQEEDEEPHRCNIPRVPELRPAFKKDGTITAANASKISDGAAATILMTADEAEKRGIEPLARIVAHATFAHEPEWFTTAPSTAVAMVIEKAGWTTEEVDLFEINEAFASVTMAAMADNALDHAKVNVKGGACALGHPIGASGARILVTLIHALRRRGLKKGVASLCLGGGEAVAVAIEI